MELSETRHEDGAGLKCVLLTAYNIKLEPLYFRENATECFGKKDFCWCRSFKFFSKRFGSADGTEWNNRNENDLKTLFVIESSWMGPSIAALLCCPSLRPLWCLWKCCCEKLELSMSLQTTTLAIRINYFWWLLCLWWGAIGLFSHHFHNLKHKAGRARRVIILLAQWTKWAGIAKNAVLLYLLLLKSSSLCDRLEWQQ